MHPSYQSQLPVVTIDSPQPGHGSGSLPDSMDPFRNHSAYRIGTREQRHVAILLQLLLSYHHAVQLALPSLTEDSYHQ